MRGVREEDTSISKTSGEAGTEGGWKAVEEFSKEVEDVGRGVNHHWGLRGIDVKFGEAHWS